MTIVDSAQFGQAIRAQRKQRGWTQDDLAARCGVGLRFISDLERGKPSCQLGKALTVAREVGLRLGDLSDRRSPQKPIAADPLSKLPRY